VSRPPIAPSKLDIDILRELYREGAVNIAGVDPRLNATRIAHRLHVGRRRVAARLKVWREVGFLRQYDVWLNPALLNLQGAWLNVRVAHPRDKPELFRHLGLIDGVVSALDFLGDWVSVGLVGADDASIARKMALLRGLAGVREVEGPSAWSAPSPRRPLTPLDRRIVHALRQRPDASLVDTARRVGISTRTMTRRYADLVGDWAVWFVPVFDFTALVPPVISLNLSVRRGTSQESIARALRKRFPLVLESRLLGPLPGTPSEMIVVFVVLPSAAELEVLHRLAETLEGVEAVEPLTMVRMHAFAEAFDRELALLTDGAGRTRPTVRRAKLA
jgi:DNA-binding Lrp family transcriptional regulator